MIGTPELGESGGGGPRDASNKRIDETKVTFSLSSRLLPPSLISMHFS